MNRTLLAGAAALTLAVPANAETRTYDLPGFTEIDLSAGVRLEFEAGETQSIIAETENGDFEKLRVEVDGDTLVIGRRRSSGWNWGRRNRDNFTVTVTAPAIEALDASSGSSATANGFAGDYIEISASSGASVYASGIAGNAVELDASSGASLSAEGECGALEADASSGASVSAGTLACTSVEADVSSGASINAYATESVDGEASSGGSITVKGGATNVQIDKSSGGSVTVS
ncbi:MAG: head GIN domain-containing protein [Pseudomonadota bacterium]